jgi:hypothetical protein
MTNRMTAIQHPKPERPIVGRDPTGSLTASKSSHYSWYASLRHGAAMAGSGEIDETLAWRCGCGAERQDLESCKRCGSTAPAEWR